MRKQYQFLVAPTIAILSILATGQTILACPFGSPQEPASSSRTYANNEVGYSFLIPENYRTTTATYGILILEPALFDYYQCISRQNTPRDGILSNVAVSTHTVRADNTSVHNLVLQKMPYLRNEGFNFRSGTLDGQPALLFFQENLLDDVTMKNVAVLSPNRRTMLVISGDQYDPALNRALTSFEFD